MISRRRSTSLSDLLVCSAASVSYTHLDVYKRQVTLHLVLPAAACGLGWLLAALCLLGRSTALAQGIPGRAASGVTALSAAAVVAVFCWRGIPCPLYTSRCV